VQRTRFGPRSASTRCTLVAIVGNVFSGAMEDLLLYTVLPATALGLAISIVVLHYLVRRRLDLNAESWRDPDAPTSEPNTVGYRGSASLRRAAHTPEEVRDVARAGAMWAIANAAVFGVVTLCVAAVGGACVAALVPFTATVASALVIRAVLVLPNRHDARAPSAIRHARTALLVHHGLLFVPGSGLVVLVSLLELFRWVSPHDSPSGSLGWVLFAYGATVLLPCGIGYVLARRLGSVRALYRTGAPP